MEKLFQFVAGVVVGVILAFVALFVVWASMSFTTWTLVGPPPSEVVRGFAFGFGALGGILFASLD